MSAPSRTYFEKAVADYLEAYEDYDQDTIHEYVDGIVPTSYHGIWQRFDEMSLEITEAHVGVAIWEIMRAELYEEYYSEFVDVLDEALEELEQEDD